MSILRKILIALAVSLLFIITIGLFLPSKRHLERSITIHVPSPVIFREINTLKRWEHWSPWRDVDPNVVVKYEGPESGVGCIMSWTSEDPRVSKGSQQITVSKPCQYIGIKLDFVGWDGIVSANWKLEEKAENEVLVTWSNDSDNRGKLFSKYMDLIIYPELGRNYERGLKNLKTHVESLYASQQARQE